MNETAMVKVKQAKSVLDLVMNGYFGESANVDGTMLKLGYQTVQNGLEVVDSLLYDAIAEQSI